MTPEERRKRNHLFGGIRDGFRRLRPYMWNHDGRRLVEIPVTTMPIARLPFHQSYLLYIARWSRTLSHFYRGTALTLCRFFRMQPALLLQPAAIPQHATR